MTHSTPRRKRLLLIAGLAAAFTVAVGGAYVWRQRQMRERALDMRASGVAALESGRYEAALDGLGGYLRWWRSHEQVTAQDYILYARARRRVPMPNGDHLVGTIENLRKALTIDPASRAAQDELLEIYCGVGFTSEALQLVDEMLTAAPNDAKLLATKCDLLESEGKFPKALEVARRLHDLQPEELAGPVRTLRLMLRAGTKPADVNMWLTAVTAAHADDPRFDLLRAAFHTRRQEKEQAKEALDRVVAALASFKDPKFLAMVIGELDEAERFEDALRVVELVDQTDDVPLQRECVRRYWYADRFADVVECSKPWVADPGTTDPEILGIRALAFSALGRRSDVDLLREALGKRKEDRATAWSAHLELTLGGRVLEPAELASGLAAASKSSPDCAVILVALGDARAALGETDLAIQTWRDASEYAKAWARPLCRISEALRASGRPQLAVSAARSALTRAPKQFETVATWMRALEGVAAQVDPADVEWVLDTAASIRRTSPQAAAELLPVEAGLLVRVDRRRAEELLRGVVASPSDVGEDTLLRLAVIADGAGIPAGPQILDACEKTHGVTPRLAAARAAATARAADADAGLRVFDEARTRAGAAATSLEWDMARATFMNSVQHPGAAAAWIVIADANARTLSCQLAALSCGPLWDDRAAVARIVERVKTATGAEGVSWRTARARLLLTDPEATQGTVAEAKELLDGALLVAPGSPSVRLLLAQALERLGNLDGAEEHLRAASLVAPSDRSIALELSRVALRRGHTELAKGHLDRAVAEPGLSNSQLQRAASLLAEIGEFGRSAEMLQTLNSAGPLDRRGMVLLAQTRSRMGDFQGALDVLEPRMDPPDRGVLELAAELYATVGRTADAESALAKLAGMQLEPGDLDMVRARIAKHGTDPAAAREAYRRGVAADPSRAERWTEYASFAVSTGDAATLATILGDTAADASPGVRFLRENQAQVVRAMADARLRPLLAAAIEDEEARAVLLEAAVTVSERWDDPARRTDAVRRVQEAAAANPRVLTLQALAIDLLVQTGGSRAAADVALRAMKEFQSSAPMAEQAARLLGRSGRWAEAIDAASAWKERSAVRDEAPVVFLAGAMLHGDRPADACAVLEPHASEWLARADEERDAVLMYLLALARNRRIERVEELLGELTAKSPVWRTLPVEVHTDWLHDGGCAAHWLDVCTMNVPVDDAAARLRLARAWGSAWTRFGGTELLARARQVIDELTASKESPAAAWFYGAVLAEGAGDLVAATRGYKAALDRDPKQAAARNNLAVLQADTGQWEAAVENGRLLVADHPREPEFLDTLAAALRKGRRYAEAKTCIQTAIETDPRNPAWRVRLAEVLAESGDAAEASRILSRVEEMASAGAPLPPQLRGRIDKLRERRR